MDGIVSRMFLKLILIIPFILFSQLSVFASQIYLNHSELKTFGITSYEKINPNLLSYPLKRASEQLKLLLMSKEGKRDYSYKLFDIRLKELFFIVNNKKEGFLEFSADRYNSFVGKIKKDYPPDAQEKIKILRYIKILERLRDIYPANSVNWIKLQQVVETTKSLI